MSSNNGIEEPLGIAFFNVKSGETHYAKLEPTIAAYINSSDMGINASRGQDFGWKLGADWVKAVRAFRRDQVQMSILTSRNGGQKPTTVQVLYHLYGEQLRAYEEEVEEHENPFEDQYQRDIARGSASKIVPTPQAPAPLPSASGDADQDISDLIDNEIADDDEDLDTPPKPLSPEEQAKADEIALAEMEAEEKAALAEKEAAEKRAEAAAPAKPAAKPATPKKS